MGRRRVLATALGTAWRGRRPDRLERRHRPRRDHRGDSTALQRGHSGGAARDGG